MLAAFIAAVLAALVAAVVLLRRGSIGHAIDDHPVCRACGFDLFNLPVDRPVCPECGADLGARGATCTGNRRRRPGLFYGGLTLLLLSTFAAILIGTHVAGKVEGYPFVPDGWVERDTRSPHPSRQRTAWAELSRRFSEGGLSGERTARLIEAALRRQADETAAWVGETGDFVEAVHKAKALPEDQWLRYAKQAPHVWLRARKQVGRGHPIAAEVVEDGVRVGTDSVLLVRLIDVHARGDLVVERETPEEVKHGGGEQIGTGSGSYMVDVEEDGPAMTTAPAGEHAVEVVANLEVLEGHELDQANAKPLFRLRKELKAAFDLVEPADAAVAIVADDSAELRKRVEAAIQVQSASVLGRSGLMLLRTSATSPPVPLAFRLTVRQGRHEWHGRQTVEAGVTSNGGVLIPAKGFEGGRLDVIYEPDENAALGTIGMNRMWAGRLVFRDIPINRPPPAATQP